MPSVPELLIVGVCVTLLVAAMLFRPKQPDPTSVKNPEKLMLIAMFVTLFCCVEIFLDARFGDGSYHATGTASVMFCAQVLVYERAKRAIKALKQENASLKSGGSAEAPAPTPPEDE